MRFATDERLVASVPRAPMNPLSVLRPTCTWLALTVTALLTTGCADTDMASSDRAGRPITKAQAAFVAAVNLRPGDAAGLVGGKPLHYAELKSGPFGTTIENCDRSMARTGEVIGFRSQSLVRSKTSHEGPVSVITFLPIESVHSAVYLMSNPTDASKEVAAADSARARACLRHLIVSEGATVTSEGSKAPQPLFTHVQVSALRSPVHGVPAYAMRMTAQSAFEAPGRKGRSNYYNDMLGFAIGSAVVTLSDTGTPRPFPARTERRLLSLLYRRAEADRQ